MRRNTRSLASPLERPRSGPATLALAAALCFAALPASAQDAPKLKLGIVTFLSGAAAGPFGVPARNAAELMVEAINAGSVPAPYASKGIAGAQLESVIIDEAGGTTKQVTEYRNLVQRQNVDLVIGYISSGDCLAIAPVAEELKKLTIFFDCGTPRIFEDASYKYLFRTGPTATMDNVAAARYLLALAPGTGTVAGVNQNYAWGQDSWVDFKASMETLKPEVKIIAEQFPKLGAGQYGAEISALLVANPEVVHSSFWGGDMEALVLQGRSRGLFDNRKVVLTAGETGMFRLGAQMPDGVVIGARGPHGVFAKPSPLNEWFRTSYAERFAAPPTYPAYKMAQAILGVKAAYEKAGGGSGKLPEQEQVIQALEGLEYDAPSGKVMMKLGKGHQAIQDTAYGLYKFDKATGQSTITDITYYPAECVNPPEGVKSEEWIKAGFKGAKCP
jgi:branched-chain amino acid transport system substrate-binding protein